MASEICGVDGCPNTLSSTPNKMFITMPSCSMKLRKQWAIAMGIDFNNPPNYEMYCCEDHFDLPNDVKNYKSWKRRPGIVSGDFLKRAVVPHHFPRMTTINHVHDVCNTEAGVQTMPTDAKVSSKIRIRTVEDLRTYTCIKTFDNCVSVIKGPSSNRKSQIPSIAKNRYRECAVPMCLNDLDTSPDIYFVCPPIHEHLRRKWYTAIGRSFLAEEDIYICSEHFKEDELELFRLPVSRLKQGPSSYQKRARHGVVPSLKIGSIPVEKGSSLEDLITDTRVSVIVQRSLRSSKNEGENESGIIEIAPVRAKYIAKALPQLPNCQHSPSEEYQCSKVSLVDYSTFYSNFYGLNSREKQEEFIFSRVSPYRDKSQNVSTFKFFIDSKKMFGREVRNCVCTRAFSCGLSLDIEILNSLLTCHFPPDIEDVVKVESSNNDAELSSFETTKDPEQEDISNCENQNEVTKPTNESYKDVGNILDENSKHYSRKRQNQKVETAKKARKKYRVEPIAPTQRVLRSKRLTNYSETLKSGDPESLSKERGVVSEDSGNDSDYTIQTIRNNGGSSTDSATSESSDDNKTRRLRHKSLKIQLDLTVTCGICKSVFPSANALSSHHQLSNCSIRISRGTIFTCASCDKKFVSQTALDVHRAQNKKCSTPVASSSKSRDTISACANCGNKFVSQTALDVHRAQNKKCLTPVESSSKSRDIVDVSVTKSNQLTIKDSVSCDKCNVEFTPGGLKCHLERSAICNAKNDDQPDAIKSGGPSNDGFQYCKKCKVKFSSLQGLRIHLGRSPDCQKYNDVAKWNGETIEKHKYIDNVPSDNEKNEAVAPNSDSSTKKSSIYYCKNCHVKYSSSISLIHHLRRSPACKLKNPRVYISGVLSLTKTVEKVQPSKKAANEEERKEDVPADTDSSTKKSTDYYCRNCHVTYSSSHNLGLHLQRCVACVLKNPHVDIPGVLEHNKIVEEVKGSNKSANDEERKEASSNSDSSTNTCYYCKNCNVKYSRSASLGLHLKRLAACILKNPDIAIPGVMNRKEIDDKMRERLNPGTEEVTKKEMVYVCKKCFSFFSSVWGIRTHQRYTPQCKPDQLFEVLVPTPKEEAERWKKDGKVTIAKEDKKPLDVDDDGENHLKCTICYLSFDSKLSLNCHVKLCRNRNKFICASCYKVFRKRIHIITHMQYSHYGKSVDDRFKYQCPKCPRKFMSKEDYLSLHEKAGCENEDIICCRCGNSYAGADQLKEHVNLCHSPKISRTLVGKPLKTKSSVYPTDVNFIEVSEIKMEP